MIDSVQLGRRLAERHATPTEPIRFDPVRSLLNYAEAPFPGDWTLRSSLMRLAQPHPARVGQVLAHVRRLDAPLHHVRRVLERHVVVADAHLSPVTVAAEPSPSEPSAPVHDIRTADLGRLVAAGAEVDQLLAGYEAQHPLDTEERLAVPLLSVAVRVEQLAGTLSGWALTGPADPPIAAVDQFVETVGAMLDALGVPTETGPPPGMRRGRG